MSSNEKNQALSQDFASQGAPILLLGHKCFCWRRPPLVIPFNWSSDPGVRQRLLKWYTAGLQIALLSMQLTLGPILAVE